MSVTVTTEQSEVRAAAHRVATEVYGPKADEWDRSATLLPADELARLGDLGYLGMALPERYGGAGCSLLEALVALEEFGKVCLPAAFAIFEANTGAARAVELLGSEEQRARWLPAVARGEVTMALSISEPDAGSAATDMTTRGVVEGDELVINGTKRWCSGAGHAGVYLVYVRLSDAPGSKGIGAVIVEADNPGLTFGERHLLMGFRGVASADMHFDDCRVPVGDIVVPAGSFGRLFGAFSIERLGNATMSLAMATAALERAASYTVEREQFGRPVVEFQAVQMSLAEMLMRSEAARLLIHRAAANAGTGAPVPIEASIAKCFANETAKWVTDQAVQLLGGYGYSVEYGVERYLRDAVGWAIAGGTPNMQKVRIASEYLGMRFDQRRTQGA